MSPWLERALELASDAGGYCEPQDIQKENAHREGSSGNWRSTFLRMPYFRDALIRRGVVQDAFETSITWDKTFDFIHAVKKRTAAAIKEITNREPLINCRLTHIYPDGLAPYFTYTVPATPETMIDIWKEIKIATNEICISEHGTVTHHHAVGRDHRIRGYDHQRPDLFKEILSSAKQKIDPNSILNPGVLFDPVGYSHDHWMTL